MFRVEYQAEKLKKEAASILLATYWNMIVVISTVYLQTWKRYE
jgi:hypothetical protein